MAKTIMPQEPKEKGDKYVVRETAVAEDTPRGVSSAHSFPGGQPKGEKGDDEKDHQEHSTIATVTDGEDRSTYRSAPSRNSTLSSLSSSSGTHSRHDTSQPDLPAHERSVTAMPGAMQEFNLEDDEDVDKDFDEFGFDHPSTYTAQPCIWIPKDELGLSEMIVKQFQKAGVDASDGGATMGRKGTVEVQRNPPDEEWIGGHNA